MACLDSEGLKSNVQVSRGGTVYQLSFAVCQSSLQECRTFAKAMSKVGSVLPKSSIHVFAAAGKMVMKIGQIGTDVAFL